MTGIYNKRKYYKRKEDVEENEDDDDYKEDDEENEEDDDNDYNNDKINENKFYKGRFVVIDTDTTSFKKNICKLVEIHGIEVIDGKLTGIYFHTFINKRAYNYDYMYYLAENNYCLKKSKTPKNFRICR